MVLFISALFLLAAIVVIFYLVSAYNDLVELNLNADKAWANIDVLLKQRHDELPNLVAICQGYADFERSVLEAVTLARTHYAAALTDKDKVGAAIQGTSALRGLFSAAEAYPDLKANDDFLQLQRRMTELENEIADRRKFYNDSVNILNTRMQQFPELLLARCMNLTPRMLYEIPA